MSKGTRNVPALRFKGFSDAWEKRKFGDLYSKTSEKNDGSFGPDKIISVATMSWKTNVRISSEDYLATYNVLRKGDIAFEGNKSKKFSFGRFVENDIGDGIVSHVFVVFRPKVSPIISYWKYFIHNEFVMRNILRKSTIKATMMTNLSSHDFLRQTLCTPSFKEQENIGNFLERLDSLIAATQGKLDNLEKIKRALLKHLFDQSMRFRGYSDPWEKRKLIEQLSLLKDGTHGTHKDGNFAFLLSAKNVIQDSIVFDDSDRKISEDDFNDIYANYHIKKNDVLLTIVGTIGRVALFPRLTVPVAFQRSVAILRTKPTLFPYFLALELQTPTIQSKIKARANMSAQAGIYLGDLKKVVISIPKSEEQIEIAMSLNRLTNLIAATQSKLSSLETLKKALLQGLFI